MQARRQATQVRPTITLATVLKLLAASLLVGALMSLLGITAGEIVARASEALSGFVENFGEWATLIGSWVLLGAVVVVPIWLLVLAWRAVKARSAR